MLNDKELPTELSHHKKSKKQAKRKNQEVKELTADELLEKNWKETQATVSESKKKEWVCTQTTTLQKCEYC